MEKNAMADLATRLATCTDNDHSLDALLRLTENGAWDRVLLLADFDKAISADKSLPIDPVMAKQVKKASEALEKCLQDFSLPKGDFSAVECASKLLDCHPDYKLIKVRLADGTIFETKSTMGTEEYVSEVDSTNHPFYTGRRQYVDTAGRVEKFKRRYVNRKEGLVQLSVHATICASAQSAHGIDGGRVDRPIRRFFRHRILYGNSLSPHRSCRDFKKAVQSHQAAWATDY